MFLHPFFKSSNNYNKAPRKKYDQKLFKIRKIKFRKVAASRLFLFETINQQNIDFFKTINRFFSNRCQVSID